MCDWSSVSRSCSPRTLACCGGSCCVSDCVFCCTRVFATETRCSRACSYCSSSGRRSAACRRHYIVQVSSVCTKKLNLRHSWWREQERQLNCLSVCLSAERLGERQEMTRVKFGEEKDRGDKDDVLSLSRRVLPRSEKRRQADDLSHLSHTGHLFTRSIIY